MGSGGKFLTRSMDSHDYSCSYYAYSNVDRQAYTNKFYSSYACIFACYLQHVPDPQRYFSKRFCAFICRFRRTYILIAHNLAGSCCHWRIGNDCSAAEGIDDSNTAQRLAHARAIAIHRNNCYGSLRSGYSIRNK